jgi:hypothetical protein
VITDVHECFVQNRRSTTDPLELLAKSAMVKKKVDADKLEERKKQGEYMKILRDGVR